MATQSQPRIIEIISEEEFWEFCENVIFDKDSPYDIDGDCFDFWIDKEMKMVGFSQSAGFNGYHSCPDDIELEFPYSND